MSSFKRPRALEDAFPLIYYSFDLMSKERVDDDDRWSNSRPKHFDMFRYFRWSQQGRKTKVLVWN